MATMTLEAMESLQKVPVQDRPVATPHWAVYHLKTMYLFTKSDFKVVILPNALFIISSILTNGFRNADAAPALTAPGFLLRLAHAVFWIWVGLLLEDIANQRLPGSIVEDASNKPWRPLPAGRITSEESRAVMLYLTPAFMLFGAASGALTETASFVAFIWMYNDLDGANASIWWRNAMNAVGLSTLSAGATAISGGGAAVELRSTAFAWIAATGLIILTTIHAQDLPDVVGDAARGRKTIPLVYGDAAARWSLAAGVMFWSVVVPAFWELGWEGYAPTVALGAAMAAGTLWRRTLADDEVVWKLWCLWMGVIFLLPCLRVAGLSCPSSPAEAHAVVPEFLESMQFLPAFSALAR